MQRLFLRPRDQKSTFWLKMLCSRHQICQCQAQRTSTPGSLILAIFRLGKQRYHVSDGTNYALRTRNERVEFFIFGRHQELLDASSYGLGTPDDLFLTRKAGSTSRGSGERVVTTNWKAGGSSAAWSVVVVVIMKSTARVKWGRRVVRGRGIHVAIVVWRQTGVSWRRRWWRDRRLGWWSSSRLLIKHGHGGRASHGWQRLMNVMNNAILASADTSPQTTVGGRHDGVWGCVLVLKRTSTTWRPP